MSNEIPMSAIARPADLREPEQCERPPDSPKSCYRSRAKALRATRLIRSDGRPRQYAYQRPRCGFWHLTKQEQHVKP